jgi:hypothetical protein
VLLNPVYPFGFSTITFFDAAGATAYDECMILEKVIEPRRKSMKLNNIYALTRVNE